MRILQIGSICLAAGLSIPVGFAQQPPAAHAHSAAGVIEVAETPYLGLAAQDITSDRAKALKLKEERGVEVTSVEPDTGAAKAGLKEGDVILEYNGQKVEGWEHLKRLVRETPIHRDVKLSIWRNGTMQSLTATVGAHRDFSSGLGNGTMVFPPMAVPPTPPMPAAPSMEFPQFRMTMNTPSLGIMGEGLTQDSQLAEFFGVKDGVLVRSVTPNSPAQKAGIKAGDVIVKIDDIAITTPQQINAALRVARTRSTVNVIVVRNKKETLLTVTPELSGMYRGSLWPSGGNILVQLFPASGEQPLKLFWQ